MKGAIKNKRGR